MSDLKPCPKCKSDNGHAVIRRHRHSSLLVCIAYTDYGVRCDDCGYEIKGYMTEGSAIEAWNRRVGEQE